MDSPAEFDVIIFDQPSGNVRGVVNVVMSINGKQKRIANATLHTDEKPSVSIEVPRKLSLEQVESVANNLKSFVAKLNELSQDSQ